jgi:hypothetical protein
LPFAYSSALATPDPLTIIGVGTAVTGTALAVLAYVKNRGRLGVRLELPARTEELVVAVVNSGRQPVFLVRCGVREDGRFRVPVGSYADPPPLTTDLRRRLRRRKWDRCIDSASLSEPVCLEPGELRRIVVTGNRNYSPEQLVLLRAFAECSRGKHAVSKEVLTNVALPTPWAHRKSRPAGLIVDGTVSVLGVLHPPASATEKQPS